jgi:hypothetical protein
MQLGGPVGYYELYSSSLEVKTALNRWHAGVRVRNIDKYERIKLDDGSWSAVHRGTKTPVPLDEIRLTNG